MFEEERMRIDQIDKDIAKLLEERMKQVEGIAQKKKMHNSSTLDASREGRVIENVKAEVDDVRYQDYVTAVYQHIMDESKKYQQNVIDNQT